MTEEEVTNLQELLRDKEVELLAKIQSLEKQKRDDETKREVEWEKLKRAQEELDARVRDIPTTSKNMQEGLLKFDDTILEETQQVLIHGNSDDNMYAHVETYPVQLPANRNEKSVGLKDVLNTIPNFNGYDISVFHFTRACEHAREMIPHNLESSLVRLVINKLQGRAFNTIIDREISSIRDLTTQLKNLFAPFKTLNEYRGELASIFQRPEENIIDYIGRFNDLKAALNDGMRQKYGNNIPLGLKNETDCDILDGFVRGLLPQIRDKLEIQKYSNLSSAIDKAVNISKVVEIDRKRLGYRSNNPRNENRQSNARNDNRYNHARYEERYSNSRNYNQGDDSRNFNRYNDDRNRYYNPQNEAQRPFNSNSQNRYQPLNPRAASFSPRNANATAPSSDRYDKSQTNKSLVCRYCKIPGHSIEECRKRAYNAQFRSTGSDNSPPEKYKNNYNNDKTTSNNNNNEKQHRVHFLEPIPPEDSPPSTSQMSI